MDRVLSTPELLGCVFGYLGKRSQLSCALVCKSWSEIALDALWKDLDSPCPLLSLLSPLQLHDETSPPSLHFQRSIRFEDWATFDRHAPRVRYLDLDFDSMFSDAAIADQVFVEVALKRRTVTLLPGLVNLTVSPARDIDLMHMLLFMSSSVRQLRFWCPDRESEWESSDDDNGNSVAEFFKECAHRMPKLKVFKLCAPTYSISWSVTRIQKYLVHFLEQMQDLEEFTSPAYALTSEIVDALAGLPSLRNVKRWYPSYAGPGRQEDVLLFRPPCVSSGGGSTFAFPALVAIYFSATFQDAIRFLEQDHIAPNLLSLKIYSPQFESADRLHHLLVSLSRHRARLRELELSSAALPIYEPVRNEGGLELDRVTLQTLLPLLDFADLRCFQVNYHRPLKLSNSDLEELLNKWPLSASLEELHLCYSPLLKEKPVLTPDVLLIIAKYCPNLLCLSLYLDTHVPTASDPISPSPVRFPPSLQSINFGTSPLDELDVSDFALYLSSLLPSTSNCDVFCSVHKLLDELLTARDKDSPGSDPNFSYRVHPDVEARWSKLSWALKPLIRARGEGRACSKELAMRV